MRPAFDFRGRPMRPHRYPPNAPAEVLAWQCIRCDQWIQEYAYEQRGSCPAWWQRTVRRFR